MVEDPANGVNISLPKTGTACYVKVGAFTYGGIFQRRTFKEEIGGRKYDIILESPAKLLDGVQVILSSFEGTAYNVGDSYDRLQPWSNPNATSSDITNVLNPFGHKENFTFGGRFGAANTNSAGFLARELLDILEEIVADKNATFGGRII